MKDNSTKQLLLSVLGIAVLAISVVGVSFAFFTYTRTGTQNNVISTGEIFFDFTEGTGISLTNLMPGDTVSETLTFKVIGRNQGTAPVNYTVKAVAGDSVADKTLLKDDEVKLTLTASKTGAATVTNNFATATAAGASNNTARTNGITLATGTIPTSATNTVVTFTLKMEINTDNVLVSDTDASADYCSSGTTDTTAYSGMVDGTAPTTCAATGKPAWGSTYYSLKVKVEANA